MKNLAFLVLLVMSLPLYAAPENVNLYNAGKLYIAEPANGANTVSLRVENAVKFVTETNVTLDGTFKIGGNFIQDSDKHVFPVDNEGYGTSTGKMVFGLEQDAARYVTTSDLETFDRASQYVAFPNIEIATNDTIVLPAQMGVDALNVKRDDKEGAILLKSDGIPSSDPNGAELVYDASLRITGTENSSANLVTLGAVVVEQYVKAYRNGEQLFPFASPYLNTQLSGYFAGNWIRRMLRDEMMHTEYVLGNKPDATNPIFISRDQYVTDPYEHLIAGNAYLIKPRNAGYNYGQLVAEGGLSITGDEASVYDKDKFIFNGEVYTITKYPEQLFAEDELFSYKFGTQTTLPHTLNWVIGNSYSAPLSVDAIREEIWDSDLYIYPYIYIYPPGSTSMQYIQLDENHQIGDNPYTDIPAKSIFMIRVDKNQGAGIPAGTTFTIGKKHLRHGNLSENFLRAKAAATDVNQDVSIRATLAENPNVYDFTAIGLRQNAAENATDAYDIPKVYTAAQEGFQIYTTTPSESKLAVNGMPLDTESVPLNFKPQSGETDYTLTVSETGNDGLWLEDLKTDEIIDLLQTPAYTFTAADTDPEERFIVHFTDPDISTDVMSGDTDNSIYAKLQNDRLMLSGLAGIDVNSRVYIYSMLGETLFAGTISQYPHQEFNVNLVKNVYVVSVRGKRNADIKVIK